MCVERSKVAGLPFAYRVTSDFEVMLWRKATRRARPIATVELRRCKEVIGWSKCSGEVGKRVDDVSMVEVSHVAAFRTNFSWFPMKIHGIRVRGGNGDRGLALETNANARMSRVRGESGQPLGASRSPLPPPALALRYLAFCSSPE